VKPTPAKPAHARALALARTITFAAVAASTGAAETFAGPAGLAAPPPPERLPFAGLGTVTLYAPATAPDAVVLFVSGDGGWNLGVVAMAERIRDQGALVAGIDIRPFLRSLEAGGRCAYPAGTLEELSRAIQLRRRLPEYQPPILIGYSSGATLVYAALAAAPPETFAGAISLGFCPDLEIRRAPCRMRGLAFTERTKRIGYDLLPFAGLRVPWHVLQGEIDQVCSPEAARAFVAASGGARLHLLPKVGHGFSVTRNWEPQYLEAYREIVEARAQATAADAPASSAAIAGLSLVEVPAQHAGQDLFAVLLTGDGGWAEIDKGVAAGLAEHGVPSVGWSSLRYYWTPRTPESAAADLARIIDHYASAWNKGRVLLVGYSFGADVLPFLVTRLPEALRERVAGVALLGLSKTAAFEFHLSSWLGRGGDEHYQTLPELARLRLPTVCVHGQDESDSACLSLRTPSVRAVSVGEGHHFGGDYARVARAILSSLGLR
jgi:type IV secretory pathway VirJ component